LLICRGGKEKKWGGFAEGGGGEEKGEKGGELLSRSERKKRILGKRGALRGEKGGLCNCRVQGGGKGGGGEKGKKGKQAEGKKRVAPFPLYSTEG